MARRIKPTRSRSGAVRTTSNQTNNGTIHRAAGMIVVDTTPASYEGLRLFLLVLLFWIFGNMGKLLEDSGKPIAKRNVVGVLDPPYLDLV